MTEPHRPGVAALGQNPACDSQVSLRGPRDTAVTESEPGSANRPVDPPCLDSATLLGGRGSVAICHRGLIYRLQTTKQGKLILTK